jgi:hypothetical protein
LDSEFNNLLDEKDSFRDAAAWLHEPTQAAGFLGFAEKLNRVNERFPE